MKAWLFDVDGVITDLKQKKVTEPQILEKLVERLEKGEPIALVTGRSIKWLEEELVSKIRELISSELLINFFISGEFGGVSVSFENGKEIKNVDEELSVPADVVREAENITREFSESMFFDSTKETIATIEIKDGYQDMDKFKRDQKVIADKFRQLIKIAKIENKFEVTEDTIGANIKNKKANKENSALQVLEWLRSKNLNPSEFICFGDSPSDLEMGQKISKEGKKVRFVFVGDPSLVKNKDLSFTVKLTNSLYEKGTLEYLQSST